MTRDLDPSLFVRSQTVSTSDESILRSRAAFYLDPPLSLTTANLPASANALAVNAHLANGSRVWIYELRRPAHQSKPFYNMRGYAQRGRYRRDIIVLDASRTSLLLRASRYENLLAGTLRFATLKFLALAGLFPLIVALPAGRAILDGRRVRARCQSHLCVACGYPLVQLDHGVQPCMECSQIQWPADASIAR